MNVVAIVQARMGSTRLPGKVLLDLGGRSVLDRVISRLRRASRLSEVVVATTNSEADAAIVSEGQKLGVLLFRGSENDVLDRYYRAALRAHADAVVRVTSDCPLIEPELVDEVVSKFLEDRADYASNCSPRTFPRGLDTEVFAMTALTKAWKEAARPHEREHVTPYFYEHPEKFRLSFARAESDYSQYRWTLDTVDDFDLLKAIYANFANRDDFGWREVIELMDRHPKLVALNSHILQKPLVTS